MKMPTEFTLNHVKVSALFLIGLVLFVVGSSILIQMIVPYAATQTISLCQLLIGIVWILSWVIRGAWKSSRDYTVSTMGRITLKTYIGEIKQVYENNFGKLEEDDG